MFIFYIVLCFSIFALIFLSNRKAYGVGHSIARSSIIRHYFSKDKTTIYYKNFFYQVGKISSIAYPNSLLKSLKEKNSYLNRNEKDLLISIGQSSFSCILMLLIYLLSHYSIYLLLSLIFPSIFIFEIFIAEKLYKQNLDQSVPHFISCLNVLLVESETPLSKALQIIIEGLPIHMKSIKIELHKILEQSKQSSLSETLSNWETDSGYFKDLISLLISSQEGASKSALKSYINNFENQAKEEIQEKIKNRSENLQLYLIGPVIVIFLIIIQPMISAINHAISNGF